MIKRRTWLPLGLICLGAALLIGSLVFLFLPYLRAANTEIPVPENILGLQQTSITRGAAALDEFNQMHGQPLEVTAGVKAVYGSNADMTIWVAESSTEAKAIELLAAMHNRIAEVNSPFTPTGSFTGFGREVYTLDGMGQSHFYFQSNHYLIWLAANPELADASIQQVLGFYTQLPSTH